MRRPLTMPLARLAVTLALTMVAVAALLVGCSSAKGSGAKPSLVSIGGGLRGPSGLTATVYATGVPNVSALVFDEQGQLWAASGAFEDKGTDGIYVVDQKGGMARKVISDSHTPLGLLWIGNTLYVSQKEAVVAYAGFSGTAFASTRVVLQLPTGVGEVNGMVLGPDGRIHLGISAPCDSCTPTNPLSGAVVSFLPDGSGLRVDASGIRAPIGLTYRRATGALYVTMNQRDDLGDATPGDWLAVVSDGQRWGFPGCYGQGGTACSTAPAPIAALDKHAAVSGVVVLADELGATYRDVALVAEWTKGVLLAVHLDSTDTPTTRVDTLLTGLKNPVPVAVAAGAGVVVGDWSSGIVYLLTA
jgi:glucose/arabinose dehydrogenase